ncbi:MULTISPECIES: hypothetical protein [Acinetobacter calcoaceticus/baumannii complex]|uniref:hypothetical protein n=1 Tax=Acinetobacter calcoaceticus/baumannii complex TaxID=909768 RepID=UPI0008388FE3|nr:MULTISPECIES: hypothetical protein [Acinetobacter calcoaceticus/baumannii complex]AZC09632.1 hypothetical protein DKE47_008570 [Acinetobacter nosocomialis]ASO71059.1 hypothetical protein Aba7804_09810 [Acinetobacter baumannii]MBD0452913.1 hypothetical protein [Acinetobacter baumannii]MCK0876564.1 hypothetical protein [Acinetobacter pittii]MDC4383336.1 hypothetical protein [Acinetobacter baumannii]
MMRRLKQRQRQQRSIFAMLQSNSRETSTFKSSESVAPKEQQAQAAKPRYIYTDLGKEKLCKHCQEYWPVDSEFWFMVKAKLKDGSVVHRPDSACKGCYDSTYRPNLSKGKYQKRSSHEKGTAA